MPPINGTSVCLYYNGQMIAMQKGLNFGWDADLFDATNKESNHWAEHGVGMMNAKIDFTSLFSTGLMTDTPKVLSAKDLMDFIINSSSILVSILGGPFPIIGKADMSSISFDAPAEQAMTLSGSLKINGPLYPLTELPAGKYINLITDPDAEGTTYDTSTIVGTAIISAINVSGSAYSHSNSFAVTTGDVLKCAFFFTKTSGELPTCVLTEVGVDDRSNIGVIVEGLNFITFTVTLSATVVLAFLNTAAANWKTSPIYLFKI